MKSSKLMNRMDLMCQSMLNALFCGIVIIDMNEHFLFANNSGRSILQLCVGEKDVQLEFMVEEFLHELKKQVSPTRGSGRYTVKLEDRSVICNITPFGVEGERMGSTFVLHESLDSRCLEQELDVTEGLLREINIFIESAHDGFLVTDNRGKIIKLNAAFSTMYHVERKDVLGRSVRELVDEGVFKNSAVLRVLESKRAATVFTDQGDRKLIITGTPVHNSVGELVSVVANIRDMTELNRLRGQLEEQQVIAESYYKELQTISNQNIIRDGFIAGSKPMIEIMDLINTISTVDSTVLITGESGVGKEVIVDRIYKTSTRRDKPFFKVNCGAIPSTLFESEMFGYEAGAFTGARSKGKMGFFELANEGTLFLDEVADLAPDGQVKLLRAIQEKEILRVGGTKAIKTDVRIIAATNKNLKELVKEEKFREDLYYRLNVIAIEVPPLRERRDDIVPLASFFLEKFNEKYDKKKELSMKLAKFLRKLYWPGNIRELENLIENLVVLIKEDTLLPEHVPERYFEEPEINQIQVSGIIPMKDALEETERQLLTHAYQKYPTMTEMAEALGVNQSTISRKLSKYGIK